MKLLPRGLVLLVWCQLLASPSASPPAGALIGEWTLDLTRTHYGGGAEPRRWERFTCAPDAATLSCRIDGERENGQRVTGRFTSRSGEAQSPVTGLPGIDAVQLRTVSATIADATFYFHGDPVFGYRAYRAPDGRTLTIVAVDPTSRVALTSVVVYERQ